MASTNRVRANLSCDTTEVQALIQHPMDSCLVKDAKGENVPPHFITPLTFGSNIFVDPTTMLGWLQAFVGVNPVSHLVTSVRALMGGTDPGSNIVTTLVWAAGLVLVFGTPTMRRYRDAR